MEATLDPVRSADPSTSTRSRWAGRVISGLAVLFLIIRRGDQAHSHCPGRRGLGEARAPRPPRGRARRAPSRVPRALCRSAHGGARRGAAHGLPRGRRGHSPAHRRSAAEPYPVPRLRRRDAPGGAAPARSARPRRRGPGADRRIRAACRSRPTSSARVRTCARALSFPAQRASGLSILQTFASCTRASCERSHAVRAEFSSRDRRSLRGDLSVTSWLLRKKRLDPRADTRVAKHFIQSTAARRRGTATVRERTRAARVSERRPGDPPCAGRDTACTGSAC